MRQALSTIEKDTKQVFVSVLGFLFWNVGLRIARVGRQRKTQKGGGWHEKLYPIFFEMAEVNSLFEERWAQLQADCKQGLNAADSPEARREVIARFEKGKDELETWFEGKLADINKRYTPISYNPVAYSYFTRDQALSDEEGIRQYLHFHRHGESLRASEAKEAEGDLAAFDRLVRTERDVRVIAYGKGPIAPFQEDTVHRQLLQIVICFERERLTSEELAQCLDDYCACEKTHSADAVRKMRDRFETELETAMRSGQS
jgi:hypothetical protein